MLCRKKCQQGQMVHRLNKKSNGTVTLVLKNQLNPGTLHKTSENLQARSSFSPPPPKKKKNGFRCRIFDPRYSFSPACVLAEVVLSQVERHPELLEMESTKRTEKRTFELGLACFLLAFGRGLANFCGVF